MQIKKLFIFTICFCISNAIIAQHFGGIFFSGDLIPSDKHIVAKRTGSFIKDHHFSKGYSIGYQGLLMEQSRFSFTYGLQYTFRSTYQDNYGAPYGCATGLENYKYEPVRLEETWNNIEVPLGARYNILKVSKFQPYVSISFILTYPVIYDAKLINNSGAELPSHWFENNYKKRIDGLIEFGVGLNYRTKNYIFNIHPSIRQMELQGKIGLGFAILRKF